MDTLPVDILCEIFLMSLPNKHDRDLMGYFATYAASITVPIRISHVSRLWRQVALSCGPFWSYLYIDYAATGREWRRKPRDVFDLWLSRTMGSPLNFLVHFYPISSTTTVDHGDAEYIITTLLSLQHRWKDVDFHWYHHRLSPEFPGVRLHSMPKLESLVLSSDLMSCDGQPMPAIVDLSSSSRFERLALNGYCELSPGVAPISSTVKWCRLCFSEGVSRGNSVQSCLKVLEVAPLLTELHISLLADDEQKRLSFLAMYPVTSSSVRALSFKCHAARKCSVIIDSMTLPSLEALIYRNDTTSFLQEPLLSLIQRSLPPLTFLEVYRNRSTDEHPMPVLRLLDTLRVLRMKGADVTGRFLEEFIVSASTEDRPLCPALHTLELNFRCREDSNPRLEPLVSMTRSRREILKTFKRVKIKDISSFPAKDCGTVEVDSRDWDVNELRVHLNGRRFALTIEGDEVHPYPFTEPNS